MTEDSDITFHEEPEPHDGWRRWVRHLHQEDPPDDMPWRHVCGACFTAANDETHPYNLFTSSSQWKQRFWECDRCGTRRFWHTAFEFYPRIRALEEGIDEKTLEDAVAIEELMEEDDAG